MFAFPIYSDCIPILVNTCDILSTPHYPSYYLSIRQIHVQLKRFNSSLVESFHV